jgi:hypothetical protein
MYFPGYEAPEKTAVLKNPFKSRALAEPWKKGLRVIIEVVLSADPIASIH